jgi:hypothetical protein
VNRDLKSVPRKLRLPIHILVALLLLGRPGVLRADALEDGARQLAAKIAAALSPGEAVALNVRNLSSLGPVTVTAIRRSLEAELQGRGIRLVPSRVGPVEVTVTLAENFQGHVWVAEVQRGETLRTIVTALPRSAAAPFRIVPTLAVEKELIWEQDSPIVDLALLDTVDQSMAVLEAGKLSLYKRRGDLWELRRVFSIPSKQPWPRDLRGKILRKRIESSDSLLVFLPGTQCGFSMEESPEGSALNCEAAPESSLIFPILKGQGVVGATRIPPGRNFFGPEFRADAFHATLPEPFYSAAVLADEHGNDLFVMGGVDGRAYSYDHRGISSGTTDLRGGELVGIKTNCRSGWQVLATGAGDWTQPDLLRAYEIYAGAATPVASPAEFPGPIISMGSSSDGSAVAMVANLMTGRYEAYRVSVYCGR